ncbi:DUF4123 domain-containing protein [Acinetobacter sp. NIPH 2699]|uniref:DUF4123 domain-containing protein n=1 Tax=Acinetobacter sp. NIPH 2699 TaxID=2923433 RepID=UPI001F4B420C|nr:DUF4123 domain-containing protein [Acinetobacter sp. NIPH 2699]MCH7335468.1 DUF4123 domain-containing protein [Acinetobacter sp. NIPH 2699]
MQNKIDVFFNTFKDYSLDELDLNVYALADAAQDQRFLKVLEHLRQRCLLKEASGEKARAVSPHLLQLPKDFSSKEWAWMTRRVAGTTQMTVIVSPLSFDLLFEHLRQFLEVQFEGGLEMILAFWDPMILATLVGHQEDETLYVKEPVLNPQQIEKLLQPIQSWWYWDRLTQIQAIFGLNQNIEILPKSTSPLYFTVEQEEKMVQATFPDHLIYYLKLNHAFLVDKMDDYDLYQFVVHSIPYAEEYHLAGTRDILNFICLRLMYGTQFELDQTLQHLLSDLKDKKRTMDELMNHLVAKVG